MILKFIGSLFLIYLVGMSVFFIVPAIREAHCKTRWADAGFQGQWRWGTGCVVFVNGGWVPEANVQIRPH